MSSFPLFCPSLGTRLTMPHAPEQEPREFQVLLSAGLQPPVQDGGGVPWRERGRGSAGSGGGATAVKLWS